MLLCIPFVFGILFSLAYVFKCFISVPCCSPVAMMIIAPIDSLFLLGFLNLYLGYFFQFAAKLGWLVP
jgi:hypothetical protein